MKLSPDTACTILAIASAVITFTVRHTVYLPGWAVVTACFVVLVITTRPRAYPRVDIPAPGHRGDY